MNNKDILSFDEIIENLDTVKKDQLDRWERRRWRMTKWTVIGFMFFGVIMGYLLGVTK